LATGPLVATWFGLGAGEPDRRARSQGLLYPGGTPCGSPCFPGPPRLRSRARAAPKVRRSRAGALLKHTSRSCLRAIYVWAISQHSPNVAEGCRRGLGGLPCSCCSRCVCLPLYPQRTNCLWPRGERYCCYISHILLCSRCRRCVCKSFSMLITHKHLCSYLYLSLVCLCVCVCVQVHWSWDLSSFGDNCTEASGNVTISPGSGGAKGKRVTSCINADGVTVTLRCRYRQC
jgi:hypothetical protein